MATTADFSWPQVRTSHGQKCGLSRGHGQLSSDTFPISHRRRSERCKPSDVFQIVALGRTDNAEGWSGVSGTMEWLRSQHRNDGMVHCLGTCSA